VQTVIGSLLAQIRWKQQ